MKKVGIVFLLLMLFASQFVFADKHAIRKIDWSKRPQTRSYKQAKDFLKKIANEDVVYNFITDPDTFILIFSIKFNDELKRIPKKSHLILKDLLFDFLKLFCLKDEKGISEILEYDFVFALGYKFIEAKTKELEQKGLSEDEIRQRVETFAESSDLFNLCYKGGEIIGNKVSVALIEKIGEIEMNEIFQSIKDYALSLNLSEQDVKYLMCSDEFIKEVTKDEFFLKLCMDILLTEKNSKGNIKKFKKHFYEIIFSLIYKYSINNYWS